MADRLHTIRHWRPDEIAALRAIVAKLALLMGSAGDPALWGSPSLPMAPFPLGV